MPDVNSWPLTDFAPTNPDARLSLIALTKIRLRFGAGSDIEHILFDPPLSPSGAAYVNNSLRQKRRR